MNGFDIQSSLQVADSLRGILRRADTFGHDRTRVLEEVEFFAERMEELAAMIESKMIAEAVMNG